MLSTGWKNFFRVIPEYEYFEYPKELRRVWFIVTYIAIVLLVVEIAVVLPRTRKAGGYLLHIILFCYMFGSGLHVPELVVKHTVIYPCLSIKAS